MSLSDLVIATREIHYNGSHFTVRGIGFNDVVHLYRDHGHRLDELVSEIPSVANSSAVASMIGRFPEIAAQGIALASNEPDQAETVARLPAGIQIKALLAIWELTLQDAGGIDQLLGEIIAAIGAAKESMVLVNRQLPGSTTLHS